MDRKAKLIFIFIAFFIASALIAGYVYFQSREYIRGPQIYITEPKNGETFENQLITISGKTENVAFLTLNDAPLSVNQQGYFSEKLLLLSGYNIFTLSAKDRFGKKIKKTLELMYKLATSTLQAQTEL